MQNPSICPLCKAPNPSEKGRTHVDSGVTYTLYGCGSCLVWFWSPMRNPGAEWYRLHVKYGTRNADPVWGATANHERTLDFLEGSKGSVLDVGCGIGNFLVEAKERGWKVAGIDFDPDAVDSAKKVTGVDDFEVLDIVEYAKKYPDRKFDLITFFDVLEHVDNHNEFMEAVKSLLKPGGHVAMSMPYREHAMWLMKADVPPMHLTCWDRESLRRFLDTRGFELLFIRRSTEGIWPIVMKLRFKYGKYLSFGAVQAARKISDTTRSIEAPKKRPLLVRLVHVVAKIKDAVFFGIPATIIWIAMIPTPKRYIDLFAIARVRE